MSRYAEAFWLGVRSLFQPPDRNRREFRALTGRRRYRSDAEALRADWEAVGGDLRRAARRRQ